MIWNKQFYHLDIPRWLTGDPGQFPPPEARKRGRNSEWKYLRNADILSMPDKWEYPWYASWDLAFHCIPFALIDASLREAPAGAPHRASGTCGRMGRSRRMNGPSAT